MASGALSPQGARIAPWLLAANCLFLGLIGLWPTPVDRPVAGAIASLLQFLRLAGVPYWVDYHLLEFSANILLFLPLGVLLTAVFAPKRWWMAVVLGFTVSSALEAGQMILLDERYPSGLDVLANTAGSLIGALLVVTWRKSRRLSP